MTGGKTLKFSVVIPTYNREAFIEKTLESVFEQTYQNYEVIVVDNCSTDRTDEVLAPYILEKKIKFIKHDKNFERAKSRNTGMENATGDFLTFLDSDDFMFPNNLLDAAEFASNNPEYKVFHSLYSLVDANRQTIYAYKLPSLKNQIAAITGGNFMACIGNFIHRDIYQSMKFDTHAALTGGEDWEFWLRVLADFKVGRIEKINSGIQHHSARTINNQNIGLMEDGLVYMIDKFRKDEHLSKVYAEHLNRMEANCFLYLNVLANDEKLKDKAFDYLRTALKKDKSVFFSFRFQRNLRRTLVNMFRQPRQI